MKGVYLPFRVETGWRPGLVTFGRIRTASRPRRDSFEWRTIQPLAAGRRLKQKDYP